MSTEACHIRPNPVTLREVAVSITDEAAVALREEFHGRPDRLPDLHSHESWRHYLSDRAAGLPLLSFVSCLVAVSRFCGREGVRRVLATIAANFDLDVAPARRLPHIDRALDEERLDVLSAAADLDYAVRRGIADGRLDAKDLRDIQAKVVALKSEADDLCELPEGEVRS